MKSTLTFDEQRQSFYKTHFPEFWWDIEKHEYALYDAHVISQSEVDEIREAASAAWGIFDSVALLLRTLDHQTLEEEMGIPPAAVNVVRAHHPGVGNSVVARFDFIKTPQGYKVIELNAETPFFYWETNRISGEIVKSLGYADPNAGVEQALVDSIVNAMRSTGKPVENVSVTAYNPYREDYFTAEYLRQLLEQRLGTPVRLTPIHELQVDENGVYDEQGRIDFLYRFYPLEHLALEEGADTLFQLIEEGKVVVINPPSALLIQNKMTQAIIWNLAQEKQFFSPEQIGQIKKYFLPTYADLPQDGLTYVRKPVLGREGNTVTIINPDASEIHSLYDDYDGQPMTYQLCVDSPTVSYRKTDGIHQGYAITTCFVAGGKPGAIGMRVGGKITDGWAHFLPLAIRK